MRSCIRLVYITVGLAAAGLPQAAPPAAPPATQADALYRDREHLPSAERAASIWSAALQANASDFNAAWKLSRVRYWLGEHRQPATARRADYDAGVAAARAAIAAQPRRPEGHFWLGANLAAIAQSGGVFAGLKYRTPIRQAFETVLTLDRGFDRGAALCALSSYYLKVPGVFGGSKSRSEALARECLAHDDNSTLAHFFLAQSLEALGRSAEARRELERVIEAPLDPDYVPEGKEWKARARALLDKLGGGRVARIARSASTRWGISTVSGTPLVARDNRGHPPSPLPHGTVIRC